MNDIAILGTIAGLFILLGTLIPFITAEFDGTSTSYDTDVTADLDQDDISPTGAWNILLSISKMFFWTFGDLPFFLDSFFIVLRLIFWVTLARNIWIGGGA